MKSICWVILFDVILASTLNLSDLQKKILDDVTWNIKLLLFKEALGHPDEAETRSTPRIEAYLMPTSNRRQGENLPVSNDDTDMKMKLFRLMYETIRDSDLKVKRAEIINAYYLNSSVFEIGFLMGDIIDRFNVMSDIASTVTRLYDSWKPIEHINAYEQIANQAIETSHLIDLVRSVKRLEGKPK